MFSKGMETLRSLIHTLSNTLFSRQYTVAKEGRALVVAANKSDLSGVHPSKYAKGVVNQVEVLMPDVRAPPVFSVCALNGERRNHARSLPLSSSSSASRAGK